MIETSSKAANLKLLGGELCLDFVNTVGAHKSNHPSEYLANYADLVAWSRHAGVLNQHTAQQLLDEATRRPTAAKTVFQRAIKLREALYRIFTALALDTASLSADLDLLNETLAVVLPYARVVSTQTGFRWGWSNQIGLDRMVWFIARSAADLLTTGNLERVRQCGDATCGWLFVDTSKNHSRRWCDMNDCGNRAKSHRHYKRISLLKTSLREQPIFRSRQALISKSKKAPRVFTHRHAI